MIKNSNMDDKQTNANNCKSNLPEELRPFFWDVDFSQLTIENSSYFIISRIMEHGDEGAVRFLLSSFSREDLIQVLRRSRSISERSRNFWRVFLDMEGPCTPKRYPTPYGL